MEKPHHHFLLAFLLFFSSFPGHIVSALAVTDVGVVHDFGTPTGKKSWTSISMAIEDFYTAKPNHSTRIVLHARDSNQDIVGAASAALDLLQNTHVQAILGPKTTAQTEFLINMGNKTQVPVISFTATSPSLSPTRMPYFVRTTTNDSSQVAVIAAIVNLFGWRQVVPIYEDTDYGRGIIPYLVDAFQGIDVRIPYRSAIPFSANDDQITAELYKLMTMQTRVFVVHMTFASRLFTKAGEIGMMSQGYVWIITDSMANTLGLLDESSIEAMQGVIGIRPYIAKSKMLNDFTLRWKARFRRDNPGTDPVEPTVFQFWAYDAAMALAMAVENVGLVNAISTNGNSSTDLASLGVSPSGPKLLEAIENTRFRGVAGDFKLVDGQLQSSAFEVVNVIGKAARGIGFWTQGNGLSRKLNSSTTLKPIIWPGESTEVPKGWQAPTNGKKLRIGVPIKNGFNEFVNVEWDSTTNIPTVTGFCIDVFEAVIQMMPYSVPYEYVPLDGVSPGSYDKLMYQVFHEELDGVVGDITIVMDRSRYVDFTLPYTESGVSMLVPIKGQRSKNAWVFLKPLTTDLWLGSFAFFVFTGFVVWVLEHRINDEYRGTPSQQLGLVLYFAFSTLVFAHKDKLVSNLSRMTVIIWVFVVLILTSSYTASLTSFLTVQQLEPTVGDVKDLLKNGDYVGYQDGSFVGHLLEQMKFPKNKLRNLSTPEEYVDALSKGNSNGGVAAIFDEIPYLRHLLSEHCSDYTMVGRTYKNDGFGFVFPRGSPLVPDISRAVLNVTESDTMTEIERKWFGDPSNCPTQSDSFSSTRLDFRNFGGLFLVTGAVSSIALFIFIADFLYTERKELRAVGDAAGGSFRNRLKAWAKYFDSKDMKFNTSMKEKEKDVIAGNVNVSDPVAPLDGSQSPYSNFSDVNLGPPNESQSPYSNFSDLNLGPPNEGVHTEPGTPGMESPEVAPSIEMTVEH